TQLFSSGATQYYAPSAVPLLRAWLDAIDRFPGVCDDELLDYAFNFGIDKNQIRATWLGKEYCRYPWWIHVQPIIDHPEFPAFISDARNFKTVSGRERFDLGKATIYEPRCPFPRDCFIDTQKKLLLRLDEQGIATVIGRFTTELFLALTDCVTQAQAH